MADPKRGGGMSRLLGMVGGMTLGGMLGFLAAAVILNVTTGGLGGVLAFAAFFGTPIFGAFKGYEIISKNQVSRPIVMMPPAPPVSLPSQPDAPLAMAPEPAQEVSHSQPRPEFLDTILKKGNGATTPEKVVETQGTGTSPAV
jgi:hypothetical protein